ncbi:MAG: hypothetical protein CVU50_00315 [Candidatus Cloacimonetes bacterium HGW-Cloacimonetes-3]|jgi:signal transduction histidine kinase|nr:MAG: hypothetical protein CVU50_00315 [Candidatus Cloacimonetes bacterium HGW-Cloacimonetes-3]
MKKKLIISRVTKTLEVCEKLNELDRTQIAGLVKDITDILDCDASDMEREERIKLHLGLADANAKIGEYEKAESEYQKVYEISSKLEDQPYKIKSVNGKCVIRAIHSDFISAIEGWKALLNEVTDIKVQADIYNNLGISYSMTDSYQEALKCQYQCLKIDEESGNELQIATGYFNLASTYMKLKQMDKSLELYNKAVQIFEQENQQRYLSFAFSNLSMVFTELQDFDQAISYANRSLELKQYFANDLEIGNTYANIGSILISQKNYAQALEYYNKAQAIFENGEDKIAFAELWVKFANLYFETEDWALAEEYALRGFELATGIDSPHIILEVSLFLGKLYAQQMKFELAFKYLQIHLETHAKIFEDNPKIMIAQSEADYYRKKTEEQAEIYYQKNIELTEMNRIISKQTKLLQIANNEMEESNILMRKLFSVIGHDIRGPVQTAVSVLNLLMTNELPKEDYDSLLFEVTVSLKKTGNLLNDLLASSRDNQQTSEAKNSLVNIVPVITDCLNMYRSSASLKSLKLSYQGKDEVIAMTNANYLHTVIRNLVHNAVKFTPERGSVTVRTRTTKSKILIDVIDTGIGISKSEIKNLVSGNAAAVSSVNSMAGRGFGLGLCISYLKQLHGDLKIVSQPNQGSRFTIALERM